MSGETLGNAPNNKKLKKKTVTIAAAASLSDAVDIGAGELVAIGMPATAWDAASITFLNTYDGTTYNQVYDATGSEVAVLLPDADYNIALAFSGIKGLGKIKLQSGTVAAPVAQTLETIITLIIKEE